MKFTPPLLKQLAYHPNKSRFASVLICSLILLTPAWHLAGQSLDDVLGVGKSDLAESKPETLKLWNDLVTALERGDLEGAKKLAQDFDNVIDFTEPYQKNFAGAALVILNSDRKVGADGSLTNDSSTSAAIADVESKVAAKEREIKALEDKRTELQSKLKDSNMTGALLGAFISPALGNVANANTQNVQADVKEIDRQISEKKAQITALKNTIPEIEAKGKNTFSDERNKSFVLTKELIESGNFREAISLANTYLKRFGQDAEFMKMSQSAVTLQKVQKQALMVAQAATKEAADLMSKNRLWDAKVEMERSIASIQERVSGRPNSAELLKYTQIEMGKISRDLTRKIDTALKARGIILESAKREALNASKKYAEFIVRFPDFPEADADNLKLSDLKTSQVEAKFAKRISAIEEVIANDPAEAKEMIKRLIADNTDPDEVSVIKSRMSKLEKAILKQEIAAIQKRLDEAQSYLTKWNVTFAETLKRGEKPDLTHTASLSGGVENLTRAISVQEGVVKQIDVLMQDKMDNVTKSQVVALQETARAALSYMNSAKESAAEAKAKAERNSTVMLAVGAFLAILVAVGIFVMLKKKKTA